MGWFLVVVVILMVLTTVASYLLTPKPKTEAIRPKGLGDFEFPTATETRAVPIIWGTVDIRGPNVIWYGDLRTVNVKDKVNGERMTVAVNYFVGMDLLLGYGPLDRVTRLEIDDKEVDGLLDVTPAFPFTPASAGTSFVLSASTLLGGKGRGGGVTGTMTIYPGDATSAQSPYLQTQLGTDIPSYVNIAHVVAEQIGVGERTQIGNYVFRVTRFPNNLGLASGKHIINGTIDNADANPMEVLYELLTSTVFGLSISPAKIDLASFILAGDTLSDEGNGMSWLITSVTACIDLVNEVIRQTDAVFFEDAAGNFCVRLIRADYTPAALPLFNDDNIVSVDSFSRVAWCGTQNHINIGYTDRQKDFQETGALSMDLANVRTQGKEVRADSEYPGIKHPTTAQAIADRELRASAFPLANVKITTNREGASLIPGDVFRFTWPAFDIVEMVIRVISVDLGDIANGKIQIKGAQDMFRIAEVLFAEPQDTLWVRPDTFPVGLAAGEELVREMPFMIPVIYGSVLEEANRSRSWSMIRRPALQGSTESAEIAVNTDSNGLIAGFGTAQLLPFALLRAAYPAATADVESANLLLIDSSVDLEQLTNETPNEILTKGLNLMLIEGATQEEDEIVGWENKIDEGGGDFNLQEVHRGLFDTQARDHAIGARCWFFSDGVSVTNQTFDNTVGVAVRHLCETATGQILLADASDNAFTFARRIQRPHHPANATINSTRFPNVGALAADLDIDWEHRLAGQAVGVVHDTTVRDANDGDTAGQTTEVEYDLEFRNAVTAAVLRNETRVSPTPNWLTFLYTRAQMLTDTGEVGFFPLEVELKARYAAAASVNTANLESLQKLTIDFSMDMGGATIQSVDFDGAELLADTTPQLLGIADEWTINVWVRGRSNADAGVKDFIYAFREESTANNRIRLSLTNDLNSSPFRIEMEDSSGTEIKEYDFGSYTVNTWTMLTITWDGTNLTVYQDAVDVTSGATKTTDISGTMTDTAREVVIGGNPSLNPTWDGHIFSPAIWTTELALAEIVVIEAGASGFDLRSNSGNYVSRATLNHLWDNRETADIGRDFRNSTAGVARDILANAVGIDGTDLDSGEVP